MVKSAFLKSGQTQDKIQCLYGKTLITGVK